MFAHQQGQVAVTGHAVALVRRAHHFAQAGAIQPAAHIAGHVGKQEVVIHRMPDRPFGEHKAAARLPHRGRVRRSTREIRGRVQYGPWHCTGNQARGLTVWLTGPGTTMSSRPTTTPCSILAGLSGIGSRSLELESRFLICPFSPRLDPEWLPVT